MTLTAGTLQVYSSISPLTPTFVQRHGLTLPCAGTNCLLHRLQQQSARLDVSSRDGVEVEVHGTVPRVLDVLTHRLERRHAHNTPI